MASKVKPSLAKRKTAVSDSKESKKRKGNDESDNSEDEDSVPEDSANEDISSEENDNDLGSQTTLQKYSKNIGESKIDTGGSKLSQHGNIFQLNLLMLMLWRAKQTKPYKEFHLGTELSEAEKFDDIVFQYLLSAKHKWKMRLLQAKHKDSDKIAKITNTNLLSTDDREPFSIPKYFRSFVNILQRSGQISHSVLSQSIIEDVTLITNTDFNSDDLRKYFELDLENFIELDPLLNTDQNEKVRKYVFEKPKENEMVRELIPIFYKMSDFNILSQELVNRILENSRLDVNEPILKYYYYPLILDVFSLEKEKKKPNYLKFRLDFFTSQIIDSTLIFRNALVKEFAFIQKPPKIKISPLFGYDKLPSGLELEKLAAKLAKSIEDREPLRAADYEDYRLALTTDVIDCDKGLFYNHFINPNPNQTDKKKFRDQLKIEIQKITGKKTTNEDLKLKRNIASSDFAVDKALPNDRDVLEKLAASFKEALDDDKLLDASLPAEFKKYNSALVREVVDIRENKFHDVFLRGKKDLVDKKTGKKKTVTLSAVAKEFRRILLDKIITDAQKKGSIEILQKIEIQVSDGFVKRFRPREDAKIIDEKKFAQQFHSILTAKSTDQLVVIDDNSVVLSDFPIFRDNIQTLGGHVLVNKYSKICFSTNFLLSTDLRNSLEEFRDELKRLFKDDFDSIREYKFDVQIAGFQTCDEEDIQRKLPNAISMDDIWNFFDKFKIIVNYPSKSDLIGLLKKDIQDEFKNVDSEAWIALYQDQMLNWLADRKATLLTRDKTVKLFAKITKNVSYVQLSGITRSFFSSVSSNKYEFKNDDCVRDFLSNGKLKVLHLVFERLKLGSIRVVQTFQNIHKDDSYAMQGYTRDLGHIFLHLKQLLNLKFRSEILNCCQDNDKWNLLVVECNVQIAKQISILYKVLSTIVKANDDRHLQKIVLITKKNDCLANRFRTDLKYSEDIIQSEELCTGFFDLIETSQKNLYERGKLELQGRALNFNQILSENDRKLIDADTLVTLIDGKHVKIGNRIPSIGLNFYVDRLVNVEVEIEENVKQTFEENGLKYRNLIVETKEAFSESLDRCNDQNKTNIHWLLRNELGRLFWQNTIGSISSLVRYRKEILADPQNHLDTEVIVDEDKLLECSDEQQVVIISGTPGMGKSTFLASLSKKIQNMWIIRIDLNDYTKFLKYKLENQTDFRTDVTAAVEFLFELLQSYGSSKLKTELEQNLFKISLIAPIQTGLVKFAFLFDGFDEISPTYEEIVSDLLLKLKETCIAKFFVTTRPYMQQKLEKKLNIFAYRLRQFSEIEQIEFLTKHWTAKFDKILSDDDDKVLRLETYVKAIMKKHSRSINDETMEFTGNPLQLRMIAEIFEKTEEGSDWVGCREFLLSNDTVPKLPDKLNLIQIYHLFIDKKYQIYRRDQMRQNTANVAAQFESEDAFELFKQRHQKMALYNLYENEHLQEILSESEMETIEQFMDKIVIGREKHGIVDQIIDGKPHFVHRTFAEYFVAQFFGGSLMMKIPECGIYTFLLKTVLSTEANYRVVRMFLDKWLENERSENRMIPENTLKDFGRTVEKLWRSHKENKVEPDFLYVPCREGCIEIVRLICSSLHECSDVLAEFMTYDKSSGTGTLLKLAGETNRLDMMKMLVEYGSDVNQQMYGQPVLLHTLGAGRLEICDWLAKPKDDGGAGANMAHIELYFPALMFLHSKNGNLVICKWLARRGVAIDLGFQYSRKPIHMASLKGHLHIIEWLVESGAGINDTCSYDQNALHYAALTGRLEVCKWLVGKKIDIDAKDKAGSTALHQAANCTLLEHINIDEDEHDDDTSGKLEVCKWLVTPRAEGGAGLDIHAKIKNGMTVLHVAARCNNIKLFQWLIDQDSNFVNSVDNNGGTPLHEAVFNGRLNIAQCLKENSCDLTAKRKDGATALHVAAKAGHLEVCEWLIAEEPGLIDARNGDNYLPLHMAAFAGKLKTVQLLYDSEVQIDGVDNVLHHAAGIGQLEVCKWLFTSEADGGRGANINSIGGGGRTVMHWATFGTVEVVNWLVANGADLTVLDESGISLLHMAVISDKYDICQALEAAGVDVKIKAKSGDSALHTAAFFGRLDICKWLVEKGLDIDETNKSGATPFTIAESKGHSAVIQWMQQSRCSIS